MRQTIPDMPRFRLVGGPYDGRLAERDDEPENRIDGVHFYPDRIIVKGSGGTATYSVRHEIDESYGDYVEGV